MEFEKVNLSDFNFKPFSILANDWALLVAGNLQNHNAMTISWGGFGVLWNKLIAFVFVRPQRFTRTFLENTSHFSLNFFDEKFRYALEFCGANSGKDVNKDAKTGLKAREFDNTVGYEQAKLVFVCKKLYVSQFNKSKFLNSKLVDDFYVKSDVNFNYDFDFHFVYLAEIENVYSSKNNN